MFAVRSLLFYILYTPEEEIFEEFQEELDSIQEQNSEKIDRTTNIDIADESPEEIAKVVRTMMNQDISVQN